MKLCRIGGDRYGIVGANVVHDVTAVICDFLGPFELPLPRFDPVVAALDELRPHLEAATGKVPEIPLSSVRFLPPVAHPGKIVAAPVNYTKHLEEVRHEDDLHHGNVAHMNEIRNVGLFLKATSSLIGVSDAVKLRFPQRRNDHEIELVAIIGKKADGVSEEEALDYVVGYSMGLDMTLRGPEERSFRKSIDTYTVLGPWLVTADEFGKPGREQLELYVNGERRQSANTKDLVMSVPKLIAFASSFYTLMPGDILFTGTPEGVGPVKPGDVITATVERIGEIRVSVA